MKFVILSQRRSGGTFVRDLAYKALSVSQQQMRDYHFYAKPGRDDALCKAWRSKQLGRFIEENHVRFIKIEEPDRDDLALQLREIFPRVPFLISRRNIREIIYSHWNIKSWGEKNIAQIIDDWKKNLFVYEYIFEHFEDSPMLVIDINNREQITPHRFSCFFDAVPSDGFIEAYSRWSPINTLEKQKIRWNEDKNSLETPPLLDRLESAFPDIPEIERRYEALTDNLIREPERSQDDGNPKV